MSDMNNFNVARDAWMPVLDMEGKFQYVSPIDVFSGNYESFAGDEVQNYVMMLFCEALVHSADSCQPADMVEWRGLRSVFAEKAVKYLNDHLDLFWMRGDKPFLQDISLRDDSAVSYEKIRITERVPSNNGAIINTNQLIGYADAKNVVLDLVVHQVFSVVFGKSKAVPSRWCMYANSPNGNYNLYVTSSNLLDSIWLNLAYGVNFGKPVWECGLDTDVGSYLGSLVPLTVRVYISDDMKQMKYTKGLDYPNYGHTNSHLFMTEVGKEVRPFGVFNNMQFWKEFNSFISADNKLIQLGDTRFKNLDSVEIRGIGASYKFNSGLYYTKNITTSCYAIKNPDRIDSLGYRRMYKACVSMTNEIHGLIDEALGKVNTKTIKYISGKGKTQCKAEFWKYLDRESFELFEYNDESDCQKWNAILMSACNHVIDFVGIQFGYMAQFKLSETKSWNTLRSKLTVVE